jgi:RNA polymerase sigma factor (sigma-70 family)
MIAVGTWPLDHIAEGRVESAGGAEGGAAAGQARWGTVWGHRARLLHLARRRTASPHDAEDAVHEALIRALDHPHIPDERLGAWLTTVTIRLCADMHRRRQREQRAWASAGQASDTAAFEARVCDHAEAAWVAGIVSRLPVRQAEALRLRARGLTIAQLAHRLGTSPKAVESLLARARTAAKAVWAASLVTLALLWRGTAGGLRSACPALASPAAALTIITLNIVALDVHHPSVTSTTAVPVIAPVPAPSTAVKAPPSRSGARPTAGVFTPAAIGRHPPLRLRPTPQDADPLPDALIPPATPHSDLTIPDLPLHAHPDLPLHAHPGLVPAYASRPRVDGPGLPLPVPLSLRRLINS